MVKVLLDNGLALNALCIIILEQLLVDKSLI